MPTERSEPQPSEESSRGKGRFSQLAKLRPSKSRSEEIDKKKQVQDYIAWVNNYLKKRPNATLITDLRSGMQDGITLINLVEIAANAEIPFIDRNPLSASARRGNIEKAIAFLNSDGANLTGDSTKDILDGSMKGVMRVILAIAEKYNPRSVRPISGNGKVSHPSTSSSSSTHSQDIPHSSIPSARNHSPDRLGVMDKHSPRATSPLTNYVLPDGNSLSQGLPQGYALSQGYGVPQNMSLSQGGGMGFSLSQPTPQPDGIYSTPIDSLPQHITQKITSQMPPHRVLGTKPLRPSNSKGNSPGYLKPPPPVSPHAVPPNHVTHHPIPSHPVAQQKSSSDEKEGESEPEELPGDLISDIGSVISQLGEFKTELLQLHSILLDNIGTEGDQETIDIRLPLELANSQLLEKDQKIEQLQENVKKLNEHYKKFETEAEALRGMVLERNQFITSMKSEIYRKEYRNDTERVDLQTQLLHKEKAVKVLEAEVSQLKATVEGKERELSDMRENVRQHESMEVELREELDKVSVELSRAANAEEALQVKISSRDKKILLLEERLEEGRRVDSTIIADDMENIRKLLETLKSSVEPNDPQQTIFEGLERNISDMLTKLTTEHSRSVSPGRRSRRHGYHDDRKEERRRRHRDRPPREDVYHTVSNPVEWTKIFYYMTGDKTETPYVTTVPRKAHEVRLKDFKAVFDRQGSYRYYFKTQDPDCGIVREEIISEDQILPAWNGKIMVWVSEKAHHR